MTVTNLGDQSVEAVMGVIYPPALLHESRPLRLQVDLDSMDWLNFLIALSQQLKVEIAESDYAELVTLKDLLAYLRARLPPGAA